MTVFVTSAGRRFLLAILPVLLLGIVALYGTPATAGSQTRTAGSAADCTTLGGGGANWTNPGNAASSDNVYATVSVDGTVSDPLRCLNYGFSIPSGATILGIEVSIERRSTATPGSDDASVRLVVGGVIQGSDLQTDTAYPTTDTAETHGSPTELWGLALTPADINAANFGVAFTAQKASAAGAAQTLSIDVIEITVHYSTPSQARSPGAAGNCTSLAGGGAAWTNPGNAFSANDTYATASVDGTITNPLQCLNYGFSIPVGATILGIEVNVERRSTTTPGSQDSSVRLVKAGVVQGNNLATATSYPTGDKIEVHGGASDLWGLAWTPAEINAANFGVQYLATKPNAAGPAHTISVDHIQIVVTYSQPPPAPTLVSPADNAVVTTGTPALDWSDVVDPDGESVTYEVQADSGGCTFAAPQVNQTGLSASDFTPGAALADGTYCWRARAVDQSSVAGAWSATRNFTINTVAAFNAVENAAANGTTIRTKLAATSFALDILAIKASAVHAGYLGTVSIEIVNGATGGGVCANMTQLQSTGNLAFASGDAGRKSITFTSASAIANARIRITDSSVNITSCSGDNFAVRPGSFTVAASALTNGGTSGTPVIAAGANFTMTATTDAGYSGTPAIDATKVSAHAGAVQTGSIGGGFAAANSATGVATGTTFTYSEVGNFTIAQDGVTDTTFTSVDQPGDCTDDFSTTLVGGRYGCKIGSAATAAIGRFKPDRFVLSAGVLTNRQGAGCSPASSFTYLGEPFRLAFTLSARDAANSITKNYVGSFAKLDPTSAAALAFGARSGTTNLTGSLAVVGPISGSFVAGEAAVTADLQVSRTTPSGPFSAAAVGVAPNDADPSAALGTQLLTSALDIDVDNAGGADHQQVGASTDFRFGRLRVQNALASSGAVTLPIPLEVQYWDATVFRTNSGPTGDACTPVSGFAITLAPNLSGGGSTSVQSISYSASASTIGIGTIRLAAPGATTRGFVLVTPTVPTYLQGTWTSSGNWNENPSARGSWGVFGGQPQNFIYQRENY